MINIKVDIGDVAQEFYLSEQDSKALQESVIDNISLEFARTWDKKASTTFKSTRNVYRNAILSEKVRPGYNVVYLNPAVWLSNALELGASSFDMKKGMLASSKTKISKNGSRYLTIPFRFATPNSIGESSAFSGILPLQIHNKARTLSPGQSLNIRDIPERYRIPESSTLRRRMRNTGFDSLSSKQKTTSIYEGLRRTSGGYVTFRRVSVNSHDDKFIHPGFTAANLANKSLNEIDVPYITDVAVDNFLSGL